MQLKKLSFAAAALSLAALLQGTAEAKTVYSLNGRQISRAEYNGLQLADEAMPLLDAERFDEALGKLERAARIAPNHAYIQSNIGFVYIRLGKPDKALPHVKKAVELEPQDASLVRNLAMAYVSLGHPQEAVTTIEQFLSANPGHKEARELTSYLGSVREEVTRQSRANTAEGSNSKNDYFAFASAESGITRWEFDRLPLKVYIAPSEGVSGYQDIFARELDESFQAWTRASEGKIRFDFTQDKTSADITVTWTSNVHDLDSPDEGGEARVRYGSRGITHSDIFLLTYDAEKGRAKSRNQIRGVALHEIGHSLGLIGHSPNAEDVMYFSETGAIDKPGLSFRDIKTLNLLYQTKTAFLPAKGSPEAAMFEKVSLFNGAVDDYNSRRYQDAVGKCEQLLLLDAEYENARKLMADALDNQAIALMDKDQFGQAETYIKRAIDVRRTLGQRTQKDLGLTLHNYAVLLRNLHRDSEAELIEKEEATLTN